MGHVMRQLVLADSLRERGVEVKFLTEYGTASWNRIKRSGYFVYPFDEPFGLDESGASIIDVEHGPTLETLRTYRTHSENETQPSAKLDRR